MPHKKHGKPSVIRLQTIIIEIRETKKSYQICMHTIKRQGIVEGSQREIFQALMRAEGAETT
jgi:hypothetical protein